MRCPLSHAELIPQDRHGKDGMKLTFYECPTCGGHWVSAFDANYLKRKDVYVKRTIKKPTPKNAAYSCPECAEKLTQYTSESIPQGISALHCSKGHGYFFLAGEFYKFKKAQEAKLSYFKLWNIPIGSLGSILLAGFAITFLSGGLYITVREIQTPQGTEVQAEEFLKSQSAYIEKETHSVYFVVQTTTPTAVYLSIDGALTKPKQLESPDGLSHTVFVSRLPSKTYTYTYTLTKDGKEQTAGPYTVVVP